SPQLGSQLFFQEVKPMKALIYINRHIVANNKKLGKNDPAICINTYKGKTYCQRVQIAEATLVQDPSHAICSGATIWLECQFENVNIIA
ncbi:MAG: hypothetical protein ACRDB1_05630, partial [Microcoleaceae cyanobacterium]